MIPDKRDFDSSRTDSLTESERNVNEKRKRLVSEDWARIQSGCKGFRMKLWFLGGVSIRGGWFRQKFQELATLEDLKGAVASRGQTSRLVRVRTSPRDSNGFIMTENCLIFSRYGELWTFSTEKINFAVRKVQKGRFEEQYKHFRYLSQFWIIAIHKVNVNIRTISFLTIFVTD